MPFTIVPVEEDDIPRVTDIITDGLTRNGLGEYIRATFPDPRTTEGRAKMCDRFRGMRSHLSGNSGFLPMLSNDGWPSDDERDYAHDLRRARNEMLLRIFDGLQGPITEILAFFVDPARQGQRLGALLMQHHLDLALSRGTDIVLIANPTAVEFYKRQKFKVVEDLVLDIPQKWQDKPRSHLVSMMYGK